MLLLLIFTCLTAFVSGQESLKDIFIPVLKGTCELPFVSGNCLAYIPVYTYDASVGGCVPSVYGGCGGNGNRFYSKELCGRQCFPENICKLKFNRGCCKKFQTVWTYNSTSGGCQKATYGGCGGNSNRFETKEECTNFCTPACEKNVCKLKFDAGPCKASIPVWSFNSNKGICVKEIYGGCEGNGNRFETEEQCNNRCQDPDVCNLKFDAGNCKAYIPVFAFNPRTNQCEKEIYGGCGGNGNKFKTKEACEKRCRGPDVCELKFDGGICDAYFPVYAFNSTTSQCEKEVYGGCGGNRNRFQTKSECEELCNNKDVCKLKFDGGPCRGSLPVWTFDSNTALCVEETYGGCEGNANRFDTEEQCYNRCQNPDVCSLEFVAGNCKAYMPMFAFNSSTNQCEQKIYGGCGGNGNKFRTKEACEKRCTLDVCKLEFDAGPCKMLVPVFAYDSASGQCIMKTYGGCQGNGNRFRNKNECEAVCKK